MPNMNNVDMKKWLVNFSKSIAYTAKEVVGEYIPNTSNIISSTQSEISTAIYSAKETTSNAMSSIGMENGDVKKFLSDMKSQVFNDLRSGDFAHTQSTDDFGDEFDVDMNFDDSESTIDEDGNVDYSQTISNDAKLGASATITSSNRMISEMEDVAQRSTAANMSMARTAIRSNARSAQSAAIATTAAINITNTKLDNIASILTAQLDFMNESQMRTNEASVNHYARMEELGVMLMKSKGMENKEERDDPLKNIMKYGFDIDNYIKLVKRNMSENELLSMIELFQTVSSMGSENGGMSFNPLQSIAKGLMTKAIPKKLGNVVKSFDERIPGMIQAAILGLTEDNPNRGIIGDQIAQLFGINLNKASSVVNFGKYNKGATTWDGTSKRALEEVIPHYLMKISTAVQRLENPKNSKNIDDEIYDYAKGAFVNRSTALREGQSRMIDAKRENFSDLIRIEEEIDKNYQTSEEKRAEIDEKRDKIILDTIYKAKKEIGGENKQKTYKQGANEIAALYKDFYQVDLDPKSGKKIKKHLAKEDYIRLQEAALRSLLNAAANSDDLYTAISSNIENSAYRQALAGKINDKDYNLLKSQSDAKIKAASDKEKEAKDKLAQREKEFKQNHPDFSTTEEAEEAFKKSQDEKRKKEQAKSNDDKTKRNVFSSKDDIDAWRKEEEKRIDKLSSDKQESERFRLQVDYENIISEFNSDRENFFGSFESDLNSLEDLRDDVKAFGIAVQELKRNEDELISGYKSYRNSGILDAKLFTPRMNAYTDTYALAQEKVQRKKELEKATKGINDNITDFFDDRFDSVKRSTTSTRFINRLQDSDSTILNSAGDFLSDTHERLADAKVAIDNGVMNVTAGILGFRDLAAELSYGGNNKGQHITGEDIADAISAGDLGYFTDALQKNYTDEKQSLNDNPKAYNDEFGTFESIKGADSKEAAEAMVARDKAKKDAAKAAAKAASKNGSGNGRGSKKIGYGYKTSRNVGFGPPKPGDIYYSETYDRESGKDIRPEYFNQYDNAFDAIAGIISSVKQLLWGKTNSLKAFVRDKTGELVDETNKRVQNYGGWAKVIKRGSVGAGLGILGSFISPVGPIGGAVIGASVGILSASKTFQEIIFGKKIKNDKGKIIGVEKTGLIDQWKNTIQTHLIDSIKVNMRANALEASGYWHKRMDPTLDILFGKSGASKVEIMNAAFVKALMHPITTLNSAANKFATTMADAATTFAYTAVKLASRVGVDLIHMPFKLAASIKDMIAGPYNTGDTLMDAISSVGQSFGYLGTKIKGFFVGSDIQSKSDYLRTKMESSGWDNLTNGRKHLLARRYSRAKADEDYEEAHGNAKKVRRFDKTIRKFSSADKNQFRSLSDAEYKKRLAALAKDVEGQDRFTRDAFRRIENADDLENFILNKKEFVKMKNNQDDKKEQHQYRSIMATAIIELANAVTGKYIKIPSDLRWTDTSNTEKTAGENAMDDAALNNRASLKARISKYGIFGVAKQTWGNKKLLASHYAKRGINNLQHGANSIIAKALGENGSDYIRNMAAQYGYDMPDDAANVFDSGSATPVFNMLSDEDFYRRYKGKLAMLQDPIEYYKGNMQNRYWKENNRGYKDLWQLNNETGEYEKMDYDSADDKTKELIDNLRMIRYSHPDQINLHTDAIRSGSETKEEIRKQRRMSNYILHAVGDEGFNEGIQLSMSTEDIYKRILGARNPERFAEEYPGETPPEIGNFNAALKYAKKKAQSEANAVTDVTNNDTYGQIDDNRFKVDKETGEVKARGSTERAVNGLYGLVTNSIDTIGTSIQDAIRNTPPNAEIIESGYNLAKGILDGLSKSVDMFSNAAVNNVKRSAANSRLADDLSSQNTAEVVGRVLRGQNIEVTDEMKLSDRQRNNRIRAGQILNRQVAMMEKSKNEEPIWVNGRPHRIIGRTEDGKPMWKDDSGQVRIGEPYKLTKMEKDAHYTKSITQEQPKTLEWNGSEYEIDHWEYGVPYVKIDDENVIKAPLNEVHFKNHISSGLEPDNVLTKLERKEIRKFRHAASENGYRVTNRKGKVSATKIGDGVGFGPLDNNSKDKLLRKLLYTNYGILNWVSHGRAKIDPNAESFKDLNKVDIAKYDADYQDRVSTLLSGKKKEELEWNAIKNGAKATDESSIGTVEGISTASPDATLASSSTSSGSSFFKDLFNNFFGENSTIGSILSKVGKAIGVVGTGVTILGAIGTIQSWLDPDDSNNIWNKWFGNTDDTGERTIYVDQDGNQTTADDENAEAEVISNEDMKRDMRNVTLSAAAAGASSASTKLLSAASNLSVADAAAKVTGSASKDVTSKMIKDNSAAITSTMITEAASNWNSMIENFLDGLTNVASADCVPSWAQDAVLKLATWIEKNIGSIDVTKCADKLGKLSEVAGTAIKVAKIVTIAWNLAGNLANPANAARLFDINQDDVTNGMRCTAAVVDLVWDVISMLPPVGTAVTIIVDVIAAVLGWDFKKKIAEVLYGFIAGSDGATALADAQTNFKVETEEYNAEHGTNLTTEAYSDLQNKSWTQKAVESVKNYFSNASKNADTTYISTKSYAATGGVSSNSTSTTSKTYTGRAVSSYAAGYGTGNMTDAEIEKFLAKQEKDQPKIGFGGIMNDPRYADLKFGSGTFGTNGCGAAVSAAINGDSVESHLGMHTTNGGTSPADVRAEIGSRPATDIPTGIGQQAAVLGTDVGYGISNFTPAGHWVKTVGLGNNRLAVYNPETGWSEQDKDEFMSGNNQVNAIEQVGYGAMDESESASSSTQKESSKLKALANKGYTIHNNAVFYTQGSGASWANHKFAGGKMSAYGCTPTSMAMAVSSLTGEPITPDMAADATDTGNGVSQETLAKFAAKYGLNTEVIPGDVDSKYGPITSSSVYQEQIRKKLARNIPVWIFGNNSFSNVFGYKRKNTKQHAVLATGLDADGNIMVNNPAGGLSNAYNTTHLPLSYINKLRYGMAVSNADGTGIDGIYGDQEGYNTESGSSSSSDDSSSSLGSTISGYAKIGQMMISNILSGNSPFDNINVSEILSESSSSSSTDSASQADSASSNSSSSGSMSTSHQQFLSKILKPVVAGSAVSGVVPSVTLAQATYESGWGDDVKDTHNLFGYMQNNRRKYYANEEESIADYDSLFERDPYGYYSGIKNQNDYTDTLTKPEAVTGWKHYCTSNDNYNLDMKSQIENYGLDYYDTDKGKEEALAGKPFVLKNQRTENEIYDNYVNAKDAQSEEQSAIGYGIGAGIQSGKYKANVPANELENFVDNIASEDGIHVPVVEDKLDTMIGLLTSIESNTKDINVGTTSTKTGYGSGDKGSGESTKQTTKQSSVKSALKKSSTNTDNVNNYRSTVNSAQSQKLRSIHDRIATGYRSSIA